MKQSSQSRMSVLVAAFLVSLVGPSTGSLWASGQGGAGEVVEGAKQIGHGIEETAKGIGRTVSDGAKEVGHKAKPVGDTLHDSARNFGHALWDGMKTMGRAIGRVFSGK